MLPVFMHPARNSSEKLTVLQRVIIYLTTNGCHFLSAHLSY